MNLESITFVDIETVPLEKEIPLGDMASFYIDRFISQLDQESSHTIDESAFYHWKEKAGLFAEFGKIVCITLGKFGKKKLKETDEHLTQVFYLKSYTGNEKYILEGFTKSLEISGSTYLCAHNGKEFDFPYMFRRFLINGLPVPPLLNTVGKKPWEVNLLDTMEIWSSTQWKHKVSLDLLCELFGIESPKSELTGDKIAELYYDETILPFDKEEKIAEYCKGDVIALASVYCKMVGLSSMLPMRLEIVPNNG